MTTPSLLIDIFVGLSLAASAITAMFLIFLARRYHEPEIISPLYWLASSVVPNVISIIFVWIIERSESSSSYIPWIIIGAVATNLTINILQWRRLRNLRHHPHLAKLIRVLPWSIAFGSVAFSLQTLALFIQVDAIYIDLIRGVAGMLSIVILSFGTYRARAQYPGSGFEALGVLCGLGLILVTLTMVATTNERAERAVINNQSALIARLIERQADQHLTQEAFNEKSQKGSAELKKFIEEISVDELRRIKVIRADGLVLASDLEKLVGTKIALVDNIATAISGEATTVLIKDAAGLQDTERQFGSIRVVTIPLNITAGQGTQGVAQLFFDAPAALASIQALHDAINFAGIVSVVAILIALVFLLRIFRRNISHPFAELLDEVRDIHTHTDSGEHRRIKDSHTNDFGVITTTVNQLINEYEEKIRDLKKELHDRGWQE